ncbi:MAG: hypothetical protein IT356_02330 [Gemmatimonadaceae bacterium]|nr:hypothetical protein [Gemmatimonadaceae bacterium]
MNRTPLFFTAAVLLGCSGPKDATPARTADEVLADAAAAKSLPPEKYVSPTAGFDLSLPGAWTGRYRATEQKDSTFGSHLAIDFRFVPDSGSRAPSLTLVTIRVFSKAAWAKVSALPAPIGAVLGERGDDVFVLSLPRENPYPASSPEAPIYDRLIISLAQGGQQVHLSPHPLQ